MRSVVSPHVFKALQEVDVKSLSQVREKELRPVLTCLVRMALCKPLDESEEWSRAKRDVLRILSGIEVVNSIVALLSIDFHALEQDVNKEQQLRTKLGGNPTESVLISQLQSGLALEFERSDPARRIRLLLSELLFVGSQIRESKSEFYMKQSELLESEVYLDEVSDVLCIAQAELPALLPITEVAEMLLHVPNGGWLLCRLVANSPDCFRDVCSSLVKKGFSHEEDSVGGRKRMEVLLNLCDMNPEDMVNIRAICVQQCMMPGLAVSLTLKMVVNSEDDPMGSGEASNDLTAFISGLLLGNNSVVSEWFSHYIKAGQKRRRDASASTLHALRLCLLEQMTTILPDDSGAISEGQVIQASAFVRLYCALKNMAALKYTDEENKLLLRLITSKPPLSKGGVRFISLGLAMLIDNPLLLGSAEQERQATDWIRWSMKMEAEFKSAVTGDCSFGEMLFLIAIHLHSNNMSAISDLVSATLGMKSGIKTNALARLRSIFTQEIFTEQVITSHAVKVPVTVNLNASMTGYLPINSIYQLLKSRSFSKHKVPIKDWIYNQICHCSCPLHPLVPSLIEVYVNSVVLKSTKTDHLNEPMTDTEILNIYKESVFHWSDSVGSGQGSKVEVGKSKESNLAPQLVMLYYLLLYEDTVLHNMKLLVSANRKMKSYPDTVISQIPINYLLKKAQEEQQQYAGLFSPLLRLLVTHYPHLCAVEDWLEEHLVSESIQTEMSQIQHTECTVQTFNEALQHLSSCPKKILTQLETMLSLPVQKLLPFSDTVIKALPRMLDESVPRRVVDLIQKIWFLLHGVSPRSIRLGTVNALRMLERTTFRVAPYKENDVIVDPLIVLRCDDRVFRCPPMLEIQLRVLSAYMQACKVYLQNHIQSNPIMDQSQVDQDRRDLKNALVGTQESAIIQILLECCLPRDEEKDDDSLLSNRREIQCIICTFVHQLFISDPHLAKLVHFQGYPEELLPITVAGIPSMHICLDFIPEIISQPQIEKQGYPEELLPITVAGIPSMHICLDFIPEIISQPQIEKQIFAIKMMSYLCCQFALPKSLSVAKLAINVMFTMLGVLERSDLVQYFHETIPYLGRVCQAFPPLCEDVTALLHQVGRICMSHISASCNFLQYDMTEGDQNMLVSPTEPAKKRLRITMNSSELSSRYRMLYRLVHKTFSDVVQKTLVTKNIYI